MGGAINGDSPVACKEDGAPEDNNSLAGPKEDPTNNRPDPWEPTADSTIRPHVLPGPSPSGGVLAEPKTDHTASSAFMDPTFFSTFLQKVLMELSLPGGVSTFQYPTPTATTSNNYGSDDPFHPFGAVLMDPPPPAPNLFILLLPPSALRPPPAPNWRLLYFFWRRLHEARRGKRKYGGRKENFGIGDVRVWFWWVFFWWEDILKITEEKL